MIEIVILDKSAWHTTICTWIDFEPVRVGVGTGAAAAANRDSARHAAVRHVNTMSYTWT